jgi:hypothetical protein
MMIAGPVLLLTCMAILSSLGASHDPITGLTQALWLIASCGWPALAYLGAAAGLGRLWRGAAKGAAAPRAVEWALGLATLLTLSHLMGLAGAFGRGGPAGAAVAWVPIAAGLGILAADLWKVRLKAPAPSAWWLACIPALAVLLVAACQPPGWLWASEGNGYDVLEYHLQLPREWLQMGRIRPLEHNVYSFLPGYIEAAFLHVAVLGGADGNASALPAAGLVNGGGAFSAQFCSAALAVLAAAWTGLAARAALPARAVGPRWGPPLIAALVLGTPWVVITGSLAYNDLAVIALGAAAMIAALSPGMSPAQRGLVTGSLIGIACGCKPTALLLVAPPVGIVLLAGISPRRAWRALLPGAAAGAIALLPWLVRNWAWAGNPVFPAAPALFGTGHWTAEQASRYIAAHQFPGSILNRLALILFPEPGQGAYRGVTHPHWFLFFAAATVAAVVVLSRRAVRGPGAPLVAALIAQLAAWLLATHIQSRFLLPLLVTAAPLVLLAIAPAASAVALRRVVAAAGAGGLLLLALAQAAMAVFTFAGQQRSHPNDLLLLGADLRTGESLRDLISQTPGSERPERARKLRELAGPEAYVNLFLDPWSRVYLLGDATPLYYQRPVLYNTTWDAWPLAEAIRSSPENPAAWGAALRARGITHIMVNFAELSRLRASKPPASGWADPLITPAAVDRFLTSQAVPVRSWPEAGLALFALAPAPPEAR